MKGLIKLFAEGIAQYQRSIKKPYQNIHHIMQPDIEIQMPSDIECYSFPKKDWDIVEEEYSIMVMKKKMYNDVK